MSLKKIICCILSSAIVVSSAMFTTSACAASDNESDNSKTLVAYYSASGTTDKIAGYIAETMNADVFVITPVEEYTSADLDWTNSSSRVVVEYENPNNRNVELVKNTPDNFDEYTNVFIGYPIWWQEASWVVNNFVIENDFTGKNVIPFCTSLSSPLGESGTKLAAMAGTGNWIEGMRFTSSSDKETVQNWAKSLNLPTYDSISQSTLGDVNKDGKINSIDATEILIYYANELVNKNYSIDSYSADINKDGKINSIDAVRVLMYYANAILDKNIGTMEEFFF
jgi:flavodoxin